MAEQLHSTREPEKFRASSLSQIASQLLEDDVPNAFVHPPALPEDDWQKEVTFRVEAQQSSEECYFGTMYDHEGRLAAGVKPVMSIPGDPRSNSSITKSERRKIVSFDVAINDANDTDDG